MRFSKAISSKINNVFPDISSKGVDIDVNFDLQNKVWAIDFNRRGRHVKTFLELDDADSCVRDNKCIGLGFQVGQLKGNIDQL